MKIIDFGAVRKVVSQHPERKTMMGYGGGVKETRLSYYTRPSNESEFRIMVDFKDIRSIGYKLGETDDCFPPEVARIWLEPDFKRMIIKESISGLREDFRNDLEDIARRCESVTSLDTLYITC